VPKERPQLYTLLANATPQEFVPIAMSHVAHINWYLLKHKIKVKNKRTTLYNTTLVLLGHLENQSEDIIILAYNVMKEVEAYAISSKQGSSSPIGSGERAIRRSREKARDEQISRFKKGISFSIKPTITRYGPPNK
jgi:hypothetical protein